ncbi:Protein transport protein Sec61 subunit beta [Linum perenne]
MARQGCHCYHLQTIGSEQTKISRDNKGASSTRLVTEDRTNQGPARARSVPELPAPRGCAAATTGLRRRRLGGGGSVGGGGANMLRFYAEDAPGLKISPTVVLDISLCFIDFVTALHVFRKIYQSKLSPQGA